MEDQTDTTELKFDEIHPMAQDAFQYVKDNITVLHLEAMASSALAGNRTAEVCLGTYNRFLSGEPVSDRYVFGLAWFLMSLKKTDPLESAE